MFWMTKMLLINTGYGNADGKLGIAMDPNAPLFVNMSWFHRADVMPSERTVRPAQGNGRLLCDPDSGSPIQSA